MCRSDRVAMPDVGCLSNVCCNTCVVFERVTPRGVPPTRRVSLPSVCRMQNVLLPGVARVLPTERVSPTECVLLPGVLPTGCM